MALTLTGKRSSPKASGGGNIDTAPAQGPQGGPMGSTFGFDVKVPPHERVAIVGQRRSKPVRLEKTYAKPEVTWPAWQSAVSSTMVEIAKRGE